MTKMILAIALTLVGIAHAQSQTDSFAQMLGDKKLWDTLDWSRFETSKIWSASGWVDYTGEQALDDVTIIKYHQNIPLLDTLYLADIRRRREGAGKTPWSLSVFTVSSSTDKCDKAMSWLTARFGSPAASIDHRDKWNSATNVRRAAQWETGQTRIVVKCMSGATIEKKTDNDRPLVVTALSFAHKSELLAIKPVFMLSCSLKFFLPDGVGVDLPQTTYYVDEYFHELYNQSKFPFASEVHIQPETISFAAKSKDGFSKYSIDRVTGSMSGTVTTGKTSFRMSGTCEKIEPADKKF
ncbi:MAG: hypothetical protein FD134_1390 [Gallionellaceae bacterium]|nr:MAG: hypothetical protein FD134_1390 [Gallionellaceae bacterium]